MLKKGLRMIKKVARGIYPCFESELKCIQTLVNFKKGEFYKIEGFGKIQNIDVWYIQDMSNPAIKFPVKKTTMEVMVDSKMIEHFYN